MAEENEQEGEEQTKKPPMLLFALIGVVLVAISVGATVFIMSSSNSKSEEVVEEEITPAALYFAISPKFKTNYEVDGRQRLFQLAISLVTREQDVIDALAIHVPTIKSKLVILLSGQDFSLLSDKEGRENLRKECLEAVQAILQTEIGKPGVERVLFTDFVMQ